MNVDTKKLLKFSIPAMLENILQASVGFVDSILIAKISLIAVSAVGLVNGVLAVYQAVFIALSVAVSTMVSSYLGAGKKEEVKEKSAASFKLSLLVGLLLGLVSIFAARPILSLLGASGPVLNDAVPFFQVVAGSCIFMVLLSVFASLLRSTGDSSSPLYINLLVNILNFIFDLVLIFGLLGFPRLGLMGSAIGTVLARAIGCLMLFLRLQKTEARIEAKYLFKKVEMKDLVSRAIPIMGERLTMRIGDLVIFAIIISYGSQIFAGNAIGETIITYNYLPAFGMATGVSIMVAREFGQNNKEAITSLTKAGYKITAIISTTIAGLIFAFGPLIGEMFTHDKLALGASMVVLLISFISAPIVSGVLIYTASLQAMGDVKTPFIATSFGMWVVRIVCGYLLGTVFGLGLLGVWLGTMLDNIFRLFILKARYKKLI